MTPLRVRPCLLALACCLSVTAANAGPPKADLVLTNGVVYTAAAKPATVEALAINGPRISAVGTSQALARFVGPKTRVIDLQGRAVVPGFEDSHAHVLGVGFARIDVNLMGTKSYREVVEKVAAAARDRRPGEWTLGRGQKACGGISRTISMAQSDCIQTLSAE